jgi:triosephosphate isomerase (TIM)
MREYLIAGNWKMNLGYEEAEDLVSQLVEAVDEYELDEGVNILVCPPYLMLPTAADIAFDSNLWIGAQNVHHKTNGAFTGEISATMLAEAGAEFCIVGHSERRQYFGETDEMINMKTKLLLENEIYAIVCVGETIDERRAGREKDVVRTQLEGCLNGIADGDMRKVVIAYEPVWAIGTGETASPQQAQEMHAYIREVLARIFDAELAEQVQILYGGSMNAGNAHELLSCPDVDGGLIGGASLKADQFLSIVKTAYDLVS